MSAIKMPSTIWQIAGMACLAAIGAGGLLSGNTINVTIEQEQAVTPVAVRCGYVPLTPERQIEVDQKQPKFAMPDAAGASSEGARVLLWEMAKAINGGEHIPCFRQETGDCVAWGYTNAILYATVSQVYTDGQSIEIKQPFAPYIYSQSRMKPDCGNGQLRGAGSVGEWAAKAVRRYGVLFADDPAVPPYSGRLADSWGVRFVAPAFEVEAKDNLVTSTALVRTYNEARDALASGYPVAVCSNQGFETIRNIEGRLWGIPSGSWGHCMCVIGVDDNLTRPGARRKGAVYILNSWGPKAHGTPTNGDPPGGFWCDAATFEAMLRQMDSYAVSAFQGFPLRDIKFVLTHDGEEPIDLVNAIVPGPQSVPWSEQYLHVPADVANALGGLSVVSLGAFSGAFATRRRKRRRDNTLAI